MKKFWVSTLILAMILWSACTKKQNNSALAPAEVPVIKVATDATWPPMEFIDEQKNIVGFDVDVLHAIAKAAGFEVKLRNAAWDGIFAGLANGSYDAVISSVTITAERQQAMDFTEPYINAGQVVIVAQSNDNVSSLNDLLGADVGAQIGTTGAIAVSEVSGVNLKTYDELGLAISDLANGKLAAVVADTPIAADYAMNSPEYKDILKIASEPFTEEFYGIAVAKGNDRVLELLNKGLASIESSGELKRLIQKWLK